jgi:acyl carrier protein
VSPPDRSTLGERAARAVSEVLGVAPDVVVRAGSLFDLPGFDSLAVVAVLERLESDLGVEVPPEQIVPEAFESVDALTSLLVQTVVAAPAVVPFAGGHS